MEIKIEDYISHEERVEICREAFRSMCLKKFTEDAERIFSNAAYEAVIGIVNEGFDGKAVEMVAEKAKAIIGDLTNYTVFRRKDAWDHADSEGYKALQKAIRDNAGLIDARIKDIIAGLDEGELREMLKDRAADLLDEKLFGRAAA